MELEQMLTKADQIADYYVKLQQKIFYLLIDSFKATRPELIDQGDSDSILEWRLRALAKIGALTKDVIKLVSNTSGKSESYIYELIRNDGLEVAKNINAELSEALKQKQSVSPEVNSIINSYVAQTFKDIDNNVNQSLLSTNYSKNGAVRAYQDIINQTVLEVQTGLKTPDRALKDNIYKWRDNGIKTKLVDKAGHSWSLEGYTRTVIRTTTARTYNDLRIQSMKDFDSVLATMSSHPAARPACALIQGKIVNIVPKEDRRYDPKYPSIYDHGYGKASGCFGINCGHKLYPYIKGVSHNFQKQYDPEEAIEKQKIQQKQRYYERNIRRLKYDLDLARRQNDVSSERKFNQAIRGYQAKLRELVKANDFLTRQYDREQIVRNTIKLDKVTKIPSQLHVETMLESGQWGKKINPGKQAPHMESTRVEGKSYLYDNEDPQALMDKYAGKGNLNRTKNGFGNKEVVSVDHIIGIDYNSGEETNWIKIHHSKKRTHIVPYKPKE